MYSLSNLKYWFFDDSGSIWKKLQSLFHNFLNQNDFSETQDCASASLTKVATAFSFLNRKSILKVGNLRILRDQVTLKAQISFNLFNNLSLLAIVLSKFSRWHPVSVQM